MNFGPFPVLAGHGWGRGDPARERSTISDGSSNHVHGARSKKHRDRCHYVPGCCLVHMIHLELYPASRGNSAPESGTDTDTDTDTDTVIVTLTRSTEAHRGIWEMIQRRRTTISAGAGGRIVMVAWILLVVCLKSPWAMASTIGPFLDSYSVDFTVVPTSPTDDLQTQTDAYGACECNLTFAQCDGNCCCDVDCTSAELALFTGCLAEGPSASTLRTCVDRESVQKTNLPESAGLTAQDSAGDLLCIKYDNSPSKGYFFSSPSFVSSTSVNDRFSSLSSTDTFEEADVTTATTVSGAYKVNYPIVAFRTASLTRYYGGALSLPQPGPMGTCDGYFSVKYLMNVEGVTCTQKLSASAPALCSTPDEFMDQSFYVGTSLYVGTTASATPASALSNFVNPTAGQWSVGSSRTVSGSGSFASVTTSGTSCGNVVDEVVYVISHDGAGTITGVQVNLHVDSLSSTQTYLQQKFSVYWIGPTGVAVQSRSKSGNPGYVPGQPVMAGVASTSGSKTAINQYVLGLLLTAPDRTGACVKEYSTVKFLYDSAVSCSKSFTNRAAFQTECLTMPVPSELSSLTAFYVGKFGNSNANNISDWLAFNTLSAPASTPTWDATNFRCSGMVTGVKIRFLYTFAGRLDNPQTIITGASILYVKDVVTWPGEVSSSSSWSMHLRSSVSFVMQSANVADITPSAPPILPRLPDDVLYPFHADTGVSGSPVATLSFGIAVAALLALMF